MNIHHTSQHATARGRCLPRQGREQHSLSFRHSSQPQKTIVSCLKRPPLCSPTSFHKQIQLLLAACLVRVWLALRSLGESFSWWKYLIIQGIFFLSHLFPVRRGAHIQVEEGGRRNSKSGRRSSTKGIWLFCEQNKLLWAQSAPLLTSLMKWARKRPGQWDCSGFNQLLKPVGKCSV